MGLSKRRGNTARKRANEAEAQPCPQPGCPGKLAGLYHATLAAPYPWRGVGFSKATIKSPRVGITAVIWESTQVYCPACGWHPENRFQAVGSEIIMRLMRALILRGTPPSEIQRIVGDGVSVIDVLAASYPGPA